MSQRGITLIELMVTMAILAVIASIAIPMYSGYIQTAYRAECQKEITAIALAEEENFLQSNAYFGGAVGATVGVAAIEGASSGLYTSSYTVAGNAAQTAANIAAANCTYSVSSTATGYTITATGANNLPNTVVITKIK